MVHPLVITAAATAGIGAAVAFELAVFRPWRDENWPHGFGEGVRSEFLKLRREVEQAVNEIQDDLRTLRDGRRRGPDHAPRRLSDDELDDFRRGVGEEASSESAQHEFEMHERQASAYRNRLRASMTESLTTGTEHQDGTLRRRRPAGASDADREASSPTRNVSVPVIDKRAPRSPEVPHHSLGDVSPHTPPEAQKDGTISGDADSDAARNGLLGLDFSPKEHTSADAERPQGESCDPFADFADGTASSWHAVFSDRTARRADETAHVEGDGDSSRSVEDVMDEGHVVLDTNGLSQTLSDQQHSFHDIYGDARSSNTSQSPDSPYRSNRALHPPSQEGPSTGSRSGHPDSEPDFDVLSDTADSQGRWSHVDAPPSPTISSGSEPGAVRGVDMSSAHSDGQESWAELSEPGSDGGGFVRGETRMSSSRG